MGAAGLGLALMGASTAANAYGEDQSNKAMRGAVSAEDARQQMINDRLKKRQGQLLATQTTDQRLRDVTKDTNASGAQMATVGDNISSAFADRAAAAPDSQKGAISSGAAATSSNARTLATRLGRSGAIRRQQQDQEVLGRQFSLDRGRLAQRAQGSAALLPYELEAAARQGSGMRSLAQMLAMIGQGSYSYGINQPASSSSPGTSGTRAGSGGYTEGTHQL